MAFLSQKPKKMCQRTFISLSKLSRKRVAAVQWVLGTYKYTYTLILKADAAKYNTYRSDGMYLDRLGTNFAVSRFNIFSTKFA